MPQQHLDHADVDLLLQQMGGKTVPERVQADALVDAGRRLGAVEGSVQLTGGERVDRAGRTYALVDIRLPKKDQAVTPETFSYGLRKEKLRIARRREGQYLLRSNLRDDDPARLWQLYIQLTEVEQAFKELKGDLAIRPIYHQLDHRIEAHIFVAFIAYCRSPGSASAGSR